MACTKKSILFPLVMATILVGGCQSTGANSTNSSLGSSSSSLGPVTSAVPPAETETNSTASSAKNSSIALSSSSPVSPRIKTVAFAVNTQTAGVFVEQAKNMVAAGQKVGIKVNLYDNNGDATTMISVANQMVQDRPDIIIDYPPVADATARVSQIFKVAGIPCISVNVPIDGCPLFNQSQELFAKGQADVFAGLMKQRGWDGSNTTVVIGQASAFGPTVNLAVTGFYQELAKLVPNFKQVEASKISTSTTTISENAVQIDSGVTSDGAYTAFNEVLGTIRAKDNLVIYAVSDDPIVGIDRVVQAKGLTDRTMMAGYGADAQAVAGLRSNAAWIADSGNFFAYWGEFLLAMAQAQFSGMPLPDLTLPPQVVVTKANVDKYFPPPGTEPKLLPALPAASKYLADTGILQELGNVDGL